MRLIIGLVMAVAAMFSSQAIATHDPNVIHACVKIKSGKLRIVADSTLCKKKETPPPTAFHEDAKPGGSGASIAAHPLAKLLEEVLDEDEPAFLRQVTASDNHEALIVCSHVIAGVDVARDVSLDWEQRPAWTR